MHLIVFGLIPYSAPSNTQRHTDKHTQEKNTPNLTLIELETVLFGGGCCSDNEKEKVPMVGLF